MIRKNKDTEASRRFWQSLEQLGPYLGEPCPSLGEGWWKSDTELSPELLDVTLEDIYG